MIGSKRTIPPARRVAAGVCFVEALVMAGFVVFYAVELVRGEGSDQMRVITAGVLILLFAGGVAALGRVWLGQSGWPSTPMVVWHVLLIPVAVGMFQSGQLLIGLLISSAIVVAIGATVASREGPPDGQSD
ncbi:MAG: hypothetical protein ACOYBY_06065 [Dermatophilaceae bacterium]